MELIAGQIPEPFIAILAGATIGIAVVELGRRIRKSLIRIKSR
jgi:hypothetical protein